jgi:hypothetical protein
LGGQVRAWAQPHVVPPPPPGADAGREFLALYSVEFGFIAWPPEPDDGEDGRWRVTVEPGDYMCFWHPWTTGDYDT